MRLRSKNFSIIDKGFTIEGAVSGSGKLLIKGTVKGTLVGETIVIAEEGFVYADTKTSSITVGGIFEGTLRASGELIILSTGKCIGKVVCKEITVESGGILNAEVTCLTANAAMPEKETMPRSKKIKIVHNKSVAAG